MRDEEKGGGRDHPDEESDAIVDLVRQARAIAPTPAEEARLLKQAALGDLASQERLVAAHLEMVVRLAAARSEHGLSIADLVQEGSIGLLGAVRTFAETEEPDFPRFAERSVAAQMEAALAAEREAVKEAQRLVNAAMDYERTQLALAGELHRVPAESEIAEKLEWTVDRTRYVAEVVAEARRKHDEELLQFVDPELIDLDPDEPAGLDD
jgi:RNA polymerase primary sigma factor